MPKTNRKNRFKETPWPPKDQKALDNYNKYTNTKKKK